MDQPILRQSKPLMFVQWGRKKIKIWSNYKFSCICVNYKHKHLCKNENKCLFFFISYSALENVKQSCEVTNSTIQEHKHSCCQYFTPIPLFPLIMSSHLNFISLSRSLLHNTQPIFSSYRSLFYFLNNTFFLCSFSSHPFCLFFYHFFLNVFIYFLISVLVVIFIHVSDLSQVVYDTGKWNSDILLYCYSANSIVEINQYIM